MKEIFSGWTIGLTDSKGRKYFLGVHKTAEGNMFGVVCKSPLDKDVYNMLFSTEDKAKEFWNNCLWYWLESKSSYSAMPVKIEISIDVAALGFDWNGV